MTIGTPTNNVSNAGGDILTLTIPSAGTITVSTGELVTVQFGRYAPSSDPIVVGDISNSGTASLGAWQLDRDPADTGDTGGGAYSSTTTFSALVVSGGTLAVTISGNPATTYAFGGMLSVPGVWGSLRVETSAGQVVTSASTNILTGNMTSAGAGLFVGLAQINTGVASVGAAASSTDIYRDTSPDTGAAAYRIVTSGTTYGFNWTTPTNAVYGATGVVYKENASGYTLTAESGTYNLTGQAANLVATRSMPAAQGSYALTGQNATLSYAGSRTLVAESATYVLVGSEALIDRSINAESGSYSLTGQAANLTYTPLINPTLVANAGSYALNGQAANLVMARNMSAAQGSYSLQGFAAGLNYSGAASGATRWTKIGVRISPSR